MTVDVKMDYNAVSDMVTAFKQAASKTEDIIAGMRNISAKISGGGLIGKSGDQFNQALETSLINVLNAGHDKFTELADELTAAMHTLQTDDQTVSSRFSG
jgi:uncharacterized protein YukE